MRSEWIVLGLMVGPVMGVPMLHLLGRQHADQCSSSLSAGNGSSPLGQIPSTAGSWIPGDWGWQRPQGSLAPCFAVDSSSNLRATAGCPVSIQLRLDRQCAARVAALAEEAGNPEGPHLQGTVEPVFLIRLVGPAIIVGEAVKQPGSDHTWDVRFNPRRPGVYMMDVVVEFSSSIAASSLAFYKQQAAYEGNPIPGSPFRVAVHPNPGLAAKQKRQPACTEAELGIAPGEWVLGVPPEPPRGPVNFTAAAHSWTPHQCRMPDLDCLVGGSRASGQLADCLSGTKRVALTMVGDSVMRLQARSLARMLGEVIEGEGETYDQVSKTSVFDLQFQATNSGLMVRMADIKHAIDQLARCQQQGSCVPVLVLNSGLHDLDKYCGDLPVHINWRAERGMPQMYDCEGSYMELLQEVIDYAAKVSFQGVKIFRTTTAAWLKYGNYKVNWFASDKRDLQAFITHWSTIVRWNDLALSVLRKAEGWHIVDGFQSSIGRPDHTEWHPNGALVHFEQEVPDTHNHQALSMVVKELCPSLYRSCSSA